MAHLAGVALCAWATRGGSARARGARRWLPLVAFPLLYAEVPALSAALGRPSFDATVQGWERALFGDPTPAESLAGAAVRALGAGAATVASELLHAGYVAYYLIVYLPPLLLLWRGRDEALARTLAAFTATFTLGFVAFVVFPVAGPRYLWPAPADVPDGPFRALTLLLLETGSSRGTAFPSSHVAIAVTQTLLALRWQPTVGAVLCVVTPLLALGAVFGGYHYAIDVIAGAMLGAAVGGWYVARK